MTEAHLVAKKLARIETYVRELRKLARPADASTDVRELRFIEHTLQLAIQAALDVASHVVSDEKLGEPRPNRELADLLARNGFIEQDLAETLSRMIAFRNILVHGYAEVDPAIVAGVATHRLDDLLRFGESIRRRLPPQASGA